MLSKNQLKLITSLRQKKYRLKHKLFLVEGVKSVNDFLNSNFELEHLYCTEDYYNNVKEYNPEIISEKELGKISNLSNPNKTLGIFNISDEETAIDKGLIVALSDINDPGNLGTIIRLCDWFGVSHLVCSDDTVDCYNPKVVQATMGSLARVPISYVDILEFLRTSHLPKYGAFMKGSNIYTANLEKNAILIMGNEARGISNDANELLDHKITIPKFSKKGRIDSLNVASATAIFLSEFRRR